MITVYVY